VAGQPLLGCPDPTLAAVTLPALRLDENDAGCLREQNVQVAIVAVGYLAAGLTRPHDK
jgi:hypothetical protein